MQIPNVIAIRKCLNHKIDQCIMQVLFLQFKATLPVNSKLMDDKY